MTQIKICGLNNDTHIRLAIQCGADFIGLVYYPKSPRFVKSDAEKLYEAADGRAVGLFVDPTDNDLYDSPFDMIQLHGEETPKRVRIIKEEFDCPVIKALRIGSPEDLAQIPLYEAVADWLLIDSKPSNASLPGGTGHQFDWNLLRNYSFTKPWMLAGGLSAKTVGEAIALLNPTAVDVSSGVEDAPGAKNPDKIKEFTQKVHDHDRSTAQ